MIAISVQRATLKGTGTNVFESVCQAVEFATKHKCPCALFVNRIEVECLPYDDASRVMRVYQTKYAEMYRREKEGY